jgi:aminopeptidase
MDIRWNELAKILVNYSTNVQPNDKVLITMMEAHTRPLAEAVYAEVVKAGGLPFVEYQSVFLERALMLYGNLDQVSWVNEMHLYGMGWADCYIGLRGASNPHEFNGVKSEALTAHKKSMGFISAKRNESTRWVLIRVPDQSFAQQSGLSTEETMDFFFSATLVDWAKESDRYYQIKKVFQESENVRIVGKETDISFSTKGRIYVVADGHINMPDGEIFTAPVDDSISGHIYFEFPGIYGGKSIPDIRLKFKDGVLVDATSSQNQDLLQNILQMDEGASRIGEFGVGTNYGITKFTSDILYDEKIGGTIHLAFGRAYEENNGINKSALHWDLIKDLREEGQIWLDGKLVFEKGSFLF